MKRSVLLLVALASVSTLVACADDDVLPGIEREHGEDDVGDVPGGSSGGPTGPGTAEEDASASGGSDSASEGDAGGDAEADSGVDSGVPDDSGADGS